MFPIIIKNLIILFSVIFSISIQIVYAEINKGVDQHPLYDQSRNLYCSIIALEYQTNFVHSLIHSFANYLLGFINDDEKFNELFNYSFNTPDTTQRVNKNFVKSDLTLFINDINKTLLENVYFELEQLTKNTHELKSEFLNFLNNKNLHDIDSYKKCHTIYTQEINTQVIEDVYGNKFKIKKYITKSNVIIKDLIKYSSSLSDTFYFVYNNIIKSSYNTKNLYDLLDRITNKNINSITNVQTFVHYINPSLLSNIQTNLLKTSDIIYTIKNNLNNTPSQYKIINNTSFSNLLGNNFYIQEENQIINDDNELENYQEAFNLMQQSKFSESMESFKLFIKQFPYSKLVANAHYWLGEICYSLEKFDQAYEYYDQCYQKNDNETKKVLSAIKMSSSLVKINPSNKLQACNILQQIIGNLKYNDITKEYLPKLIHNKISELHCNHDERNDKGSE